MTQRNESVIQSLPGRSGCFLVDVKEAKSIQTEFVYNFFTSAESYTHLSPRPEEAGLSKSLTSLSLRLVSSYIEINIEGPDEMEDFETPVDPNGSAQIFNAVDQHIPDNSTDKILTENDFSGNHFAGITLGLPNEITNLQNIVKESTLALSNILTGEENKPSETSNTDYLSKYAALKENGFLFSEEYKADLQDFFASISNKSLMGQQINKNDFLNYENNSTYLSAVLSDSLFTITNNPTSIFSNSIRDKLEEIQDIKNTAIEAKKLDQGQLNINNYYPSLNSNKVFEDVDDIFSEKTSDLQQQIYNEAVHVGYMLESVIRFPDGTVLRNESKFFKRTDLSSSNETFYFLQPPYNSDVSISAAPVYAVKVPIYKEENSIRVKSFGTVYIAGSGISKIVKCIDTTPPPPPQDLKFNLTNEGLEINWSLPFNTQRDIAKFRIFKRKNENEPFMLINEIDFGINKRNELPSYLVEKSSAVKTFYTDKSFNRNSEFIYAVSCVDVHDLVSNYSEQIKVKLNPVFNRLETSLFAMPGAFIQYPNMTIEEELFEDVIKSSGYSKAKIYFNPDFLKVVKKESGVEEILLDLGENKDDEFKLNLINIDLQKQQSLDIIIGDIVENNIFDSGDSAVIKSFLEDN